ncbi:Predicted arabinose efflux permease, MFS family [Amycolatopsis pretoriensis]|uniref:Predicted arabinose efflux permease, MFS family n=1 Tax=Amycolatopsis pretoriensis TaxID=218821 RepID=A0A1H5Q510_9PSEU|nr:MFS transporter [Amycolatopsis pretoriensis]SEF21166.1 Predicted arabinose efflux permease, MFS family [Amycolatopsis pretoriensis]
MTTAFWRLWTAAGLSSLADGVLKVALPLVAVGYTREPALIAGLAFAFSLPWLLFALLAGAVVDRLDRRRAMLAANLARGGLLAAVTLLTVFGAGSIWALYVVAVGVGCAETVYDTAAQSIVPQVVGREQLARANGRMFAAEQTANEFAGPPLAGVLAAAGVVAALVTPVALWAVAVAALLLVRGEYRIPRESRTTLRADIADGLRFLLRHKVLRTFSLMVGTYNFATGATFAVLVLYAVGPGSAMGLSAPAFGLLMATSAAGGLTGSVLAEAAERRLGRIRALWISWSAGALSVGTLAVTAKPYAVGTGFFLGGVGVMVSNVVMVSLRQRLTPDRLLGRLNSSHRLVAWGTKSLGALAGGAIAQAFGLRTVFVVMAVLAFAVVAGLRVLTEDQSECVSA